MHSLILSETWTFLQNIKKIELSGEYGMFWPANPFGQPVNQNCSTSILAAIWATDPLGTNILWLVFLLCGSFGSISNAGYLDCMKTYTDWETN